MLRFFCLLCAASLFLAGCASDEGLSDPRVGVPGAEKKDPQPAANGGWTW